MENKSEDTEKYMEKYEWSKVWLDEPSENGKRALLVGDSILDGYGGYVKSIVGSAIYIDTYATSRAICQTNYLKELKYILSNGNYNIVHFNNGLHGWHMDIGLYESSYEAVIHMILADKNVHRLILALSTPLTGSEKFIQRNEIVKERNKAVKKLAEKYKLEVNDLYAVVDGIDEIRNPDGAHYLPKGAELLGTQVAKLLKR